MNGDFENLMIFLNMGIFIFSLIVLGMVWYNIDKMDGFVDLYLCDTRNISCNVPNEEIIMLNNYSLIMFNSNFFSGSPDIYCQEGIHISYNMDNVIMNPCIKMIDGKCIGEGKMCYIKRD